MSGATSLWTESCPLTSICPECGTSIDWGELLGDGTELPAWSIEHEGRFAWRAWRTMWASWKAYGSYELMAAADPIAWLRLARYLGVLLIALYVLMVGVTWVFGRHLTIDALKAAMQWPSSWNSWMLLLPYLGVPLVTGFLWIFMSCAFYRRSPVRPLAYTVGSMLTHVVTTLAIWLAISLPAVTIETMRGALDSGEALPSYLGNLLVCLFAVTVPYGLLLHARCLTTTWHVCAWRQSTMRGIGRQTALTFLVLFVLTAGVVALFLLFG